MNVAIDTHIFAVARKNEDLFMPTIDRSHVYNRTNGK